MNNIINFLKRITDNGTLNMEYNKDCNSSEQLRSNTYKWIINKFPDKINLFYVTWIKDIKQPRSAKNTEYVNRITIDLDIRKEYLALYKEECSDDDITDIWKQLWEFLKEERPDDFWQWSYILNSWNWLQIIYIWPKYKINHPLDPEYYKEAILDIYKEFYDFMWDIYKPDEKCADLWHLFRLPWTINEKAWIKKNCFIISEQDIESNFVKHFWLLLETAKKKIELANLKYNLDKKKSYEYKVKYTENIFEEVRKKVDVAEVLLKFIPERPLKKDNKNFSKKWKSWNNSYFVDRENNIIIRNWSTFLAWNKEWLNCLDIIEEYTWLKWMDAIKWLKEHKFIN